MRLIIFFIYMPLVYSELHRFLTAYTRISGQTFAGIPEVSAETTLDDQQIDYYDSNIKKMIPKQDWIKDDASKDIWKEYTDIREKLQQIYKNINYVLTKQFTQSDGVHTYQRMCGCEWDDETGDSNGFDQHGYDGEDFISLDLKENRYIASVPQASPTVMKWNNDTTQLEFLKQNYDHECVYWLKELLHVSKDTSKKTDPPKVSLLQKYPDYYVGCHVTGFLFRNTSISWRKNGEAMNDSSNLVESRDTLPNEDGTFQRTVVLYVLPDEWKEDQFTCVVEHKSLTEPIQKILTENQIKSNKSASDASNITYHVPVTITLIVGLIVLIVLIGLCVHWKCWKKLKACYKKKTIYVKTKPSQEHEPSEEYLLFTPYNEGSSPPRDEQNHFPEPSPSQFLTGGPISPTLPDN